MASSVKPANVVRACVTQALIDNAEVNSSDHLLHTFTVADIVRTYGLRFKVGHYERRGPYPVAMSDQLVRNELERRWHDGRAFKIVGKNGKPRRRGRYVEWVNPPRLTHSSYKSHRLM